jgi:hypothetical protein
LILQCSILHYTVGGQNVWCFYIPVAKKDQVCDLWNGAKGT